MKLKTLPILISLSMLLMLSACSKQEKPKEEATSPSFSAQLIDDSNRALIGTEIVSYTAPSLSPGQKLTFTPTNPESTIIKQFDSAALTPSSITEFATSDSVTPEIIMENGAAAVFSKEDGTGWAAQKGNQLTFTIKKYPSEVTEKQGLVVGYVKDGVAYEGDCFWDLSGSYSLVVPEDGEYFIYVMSVTSDYLALKQGSIQLGNKG